jgi:hypothetical protein
MKNLLYFGITVVLCCTACKKTDNRLNINTWSIHGATFTASSVKRSPLAFPYVEVSDGTNSFRMRVEKIPSDNGDYSIIGPRAPQGSEMGISEYYGGKSYLSIDNNQAKARVSVVNGKITVLITDLTLMSNDSTETTNFSAYISEN